MIIVLMGVAGSGKTEIGRRLGARLNWPFYDGDDYHPPENVRKMALGQPLTDLDRWPWLAALRSLIVTLEGKGESAVLACSALKKAYRDILRSAAEEMVFVHLKGDLDTLRSRLKAREKHFMKEDLLASQFEALEEPDYALVVDIRQTPEEIVALITENYHAFTSGFNP